MAEGIKQKLFKGTVREGTVEEFVGDGARSEDAPPTRPFNHFHNPLAPQWGDAGLWAYSLFGSALLRGQSSVLWQQNGAQETSTVYTPLPIRSSGGMWSWQDARERYLTALTGTAKGDDTERVPITKEAREKAFAETLEALGHLTHLVQDASVPAHTRNDPHPAYEGYEAWVEAMRFGGTDRNGRLRRPVFLGLLNREPVKPTLSLFTPTRNSSAPVPIAWLIDANAFGGLNSAALTGTDQGMAEYTNGNFVSDDSIFTDFVLPRPEALGPGFTESEGGSSRLYFPKERDGEGVRHFVAAGTWFERLSYRGRPERGDILTDRVYEDYAGFLIPRAVGYSAALLDYFFRGKLDVNLIADAADPTLFRLTGTNASPEPLVAGTLTLYAEDPTGLRTPVPARDPTGLTDVATGQPLTSARFQVPETAERFVAVYEGTLGNEVKPSDPIQPGAVIGKVLGGVRVEELFSDGTRWKLRTPQGVFLLPLTTSEFQKVTWGDADNLLLARTPFGRNQPNRFVVYEVQRVPNSMEISTITTPDGPTAELRKLRDTVFPLDLPLGTTAQLNWRLHYRNLLGRYTRTTVSRWTPYDPRSPDYGWYQSETPQLTPLGIETARDEIVPMNRSFDLRLDLDHFYSYVDSPPGEGYRWRLEEAAVNAAGRVLVVVFVYLWSVPSLTAHYPHVTVNAEGVTEIGWYSTATAWIAYGGNLVWAMVDITEPGAPRVVASTAGPLITLTYEGGSDIFEGVWVHVLDTYEGGPQAGRYDRGWYQVSLENPTPSTPLTSRTEVSLRQGDQAIVLEGRFKQELQDELGQRYSFDFHLGQRQYSSEKVYDCRSATSCSGVRFLGTTTDLAAYPVILFRGLRARPAPGGERMVFLGYDEAIDQTGVLVWDPDSSRARVVSELQEDWHNLGSATPASVLVSSRFSSSRSWSSSLVPLDGAQTVSVFPNVRLTDSFTLLDPDWLYNMTERKFYASQPPLRRTALPAKLADVAGNPIGDYHVIRLP